MLKISTILLNRNDLGGESIPNSPEDALPGVLVPDLLEKDSGTVSLYCAHY